MKPSVLLLALLLSAIAGLHAAAMPSVGSDSTRADSRSLRTRGAVEGLLRRNPPRLTFNPSEITPETFPAWQAEMKSAMKRLMRHPQEQSAPPSLVKRVKRPGYTLEKWESYPLDSTAVPFLVLIPDGVDASRPVPAALCIPGFGQPKELLAGERLGNFSLDGPADLTLSPRSRMELLGAQFVARPRDSRLDENRPYRG